MVCERMRLFLMVSGWIVFVASQTELPTDYKEDIRVETRLGAIDGFVAGLADGFDVDVFLEIPFAEPPVGDLRFEKTEPVKPWKTPLNSRKFSKGCWPHDLSGLPADFYSDDCLYLNVFRPHNNQSMPAKGYPVLVWVHGGGYEVGATSFYGYRDISSNFASQDLLVVTIQYRLGFSGFASTGDAEMPGNYGYWDQAEAFKFLKQNVDSFGGDPENIIAFGLSAGGASTAALSISPASRDYVSKSIEMSGAVFANWHAGEQVVDVSKKLAQAVGCPHESSKQMKQCFKEKSPEQLLDGVQIIGNARYDVDLIKFHPRIDGDFFPADFEDLIKKAPPKPSLMGFTDQEAAYFTTMGLSKTLNAFAIPRETYKNYKLQNFTDVVKRMVAPESVFGSKAEELQRKIIDFYVKDQNADYRTLLKTFSDLMSDLWFTVPGLWTARAKTAAGWPVYLYYNDYYNKDMFDAETPVKGSMHANEYPYMFGFFPITKFKFNDDDRLFQKHLLNAIVNFSKFGNPSTDQFKWSKTTLKTPYLHALIRPRPEMGTELLKETLNFWDTVTSEYDFDIVRGLHKITKKHKDEL